MVDGRVWGVISTLVTGGAASRRRRGSPRRVHRAGGDRDREQQAREELTRLAEEQAALRRVATLVARGTPPAEVFAAVSAEVAQLVRRRRRGSHPLRGRRHGDRAGGWTTRRATCYVGMRYAARRNRVRAGLRDTPAGADRRLRGASPAQPLPPPRDGLALVGRGADHRRGPPLGRTGRCLDDRAAAAARHRATAGGVHGAGRDRDREHREPRRATRLAEEQAALVAWRRSWRKGRLRPRCSKR